MTSSLSSALSVAQAARETPARVALVAEGVAYTYAELAALVERALSALPTEDVGSVDPPRPIAVSGSNRFATVLALLGLIERGVPFVPLHPRLTAAEASSLAARARVRTTIDEARLGALAARAAAPRGRASPLPPLQATADTSPLAIVFTSGTTGTPRGAVLSRRAFAASAAASARNLGFREGDAWLLCMPICHVGGLSILTRCLIARRTVVLHPRFSADAVLETIARGGVTLLSVVPTMLADLLLHDRANVLARLRAILVGGAAASESILRECHARGARALATYGLTEACSQVASQRLTDPVQTRGVGRPVAGMEVTLREGRICVRGPARMTGYLDEPPLREDAWFDTGDHGAFDSDGTLFVLGRRSDLIVTGGENVYPAEVEAALEACQGVRRAVVFGLPDERWGQIVAAVIEPASPPTSAEAVGAAVRASLASFKWPRRMALAPAIPTLASGKVDRARTRELYADKLVTLP